MFTADVCQITVAANMFVEIISIYWKLSIL